MFKGFLSHVGMHMQQNACTAIPLFAVFDDTEVIGQIDYDEFEDEDENTKIEEMYDEREGMHDRTSEIPYPRNPAEVVDSLERLLSI